MFEKLEQLRAKPPHIKKHIAFWTSGGITAIILVFWVTSLNITLKNQAIAALDGDVYVSSDNEIVGSPVKSAPSPISSLTASVSDAFAPVGNILKTVVSDFSSQVKPSATTSEVQVYGAGN